MTLLVPRFGSGALGRTLERMFKARPYRARLDEIGTFVWARCDGETSVAEIAAQMRDAFGERIEPVEDRLVLFLQRLLKGRFVTVEPAPAGAPARTAKPARQENRSGRAPLSGSRPSWPPQES